MSYNPRTAAVAEAAAAEAAAAAAEAAAEAAEEAEAASAALPRIYDIFPGLLCHHKCPGLITRCS